MTGNELFPERGYIEASVCDTVESMLTIKGRTVDFRPWSDLSRDVGLSEEDISFVRMRCSSEFLVSLMRYKVLRSCAAIANAIYDEMQRLKRIGVAGLIRACQKGYEATGDDMMLMAMRVFRAMDDICLKETAPFPWKLNEGDDDAPIRDASGEPVVRRDSGYYPPTMETCKALVKGMNLLHDIKATEEKNP